MRKQEYYKLGALIQAYCERYGVHFEHIMAILDDPKVIPMIRGKGQEL